MSRLPEKQHESLQEGLEVVVPVDGGVVIQCNVSKHLGRSKRDFGRGTSGYKGTKGIEMAAEYLEKTPLLVWFN